METLAQWLEITEFPFVIRDQDGNKVYEEFSCGFWIKQKFNQNGEEIAYEDCEDFWSKREFDDEGNIVSYEDSNGEYEDWEFDPVTGEEVYYANEDGVVINKIEVAVEHNILSEFTVCFAEMLRIIKR